MSDVNYPKVAGDEVITHQGKILEIVTQQMEVAPEKIVTFEWARRSPGVRLMVTSKDLGKILLTKEYRREVGDFDWRLPGGKVFDTLSEYNEFLDSGDDISIPAKKRAIIEGAEETGLVLNDLELFHVSKLGATVEWDLHYFNVTDFEKSDHGQQLEEGETIDTIWVPIDEAKEIALNGQMSEERSALVLLRFINSLQD